MGKVHLTSEFGLLVDWFKSVNMVGGFHIGSDRRLSAVSCHWVTFLEEGPVVDHRLDHVLARDRLTVGLCR
jgi:hypothetical protein